MVTPNYVPMPPKPGKTIIKIVRVAETENHICLDYDIGIGPAVGYAHYIYQITGTWPLRWIHHHKAGRGHRSPTPAEMQFRVRHLMLTKSAMR